MATLHSLSALSSIIEPNEFAVLPGTLEVLFVMLHLVHQKHLIHLLKCFQIPVYLFLSHLQLIWFLWVLNFLLWCLLLPHLHNPFLLIFPAPQGLPFALQVLHVPSLPSQVLPAHLYYFVSGVLVVAVMVPTLHLERLQLLLVRDRLRCPYAEAAEA